MLSIIRTRPTTHSAGFQTGEYILYAQQIHWRACGEFVFDFHNFAHPGSSSACIRVERQQRDNPARSANGWFRGHSTCRLLRTPRCHPHRSQTMRVYRGFLNDDFYFSFDILRNFFAFQIVSLPFNFWSSISLPLTVSPLLNCFRPVAAGIGRRLRG